MSIHVGRRKEYLEKFKALVGRLHVLILGLSALVVAVQTITGIFGEFGSNLNDLILIIVLVNVLLVLAFFFMALPVPNSLDIQRLVVNDKYKRRDKLYELFNLEGVEDFVNKCTQSVKSIGQFNLFWKGTIIIWFVYYSIRLLHVLFIDIFYGSHMESIVMDFLFNLLNNLSSFTVLGCYFYLAKPCYDLTTSTKKYPKQLHIAVIFLIVITLLDATYKFQIVEDAKGFDVGNVIFGTIGGIFAGVAIALLTGRLDSKFINANIVWILMLYLYAAVSVVYPLVNIFDYLENEMGTIGIYEYLENIGDTKEGNTPQEGLVIAYNSMKNANLIFTFSVLLVATLGKFILFTLLRNSFNNNNILYYLIRMHQVEDKEFNQGLIHKEFEENASTWILENKLYDLLEQIEKESDLSKKTELLIESAELNIKLGNYRIAITEYLDAIALSVELDQKKLLEVQKGHHERSVKRNQETPVKKLLTFLDHLIELKKEYKFSINVKRKGLLSQLKEIPEFEGMKEIERRIKGLVK